MTNLLEKITDPIAAAVTLGKAIAESGMFGAQNIGQGVVIAFHCLQTGIPILQYQREFHLVDGKPSMKAEAMLAKLREKGGEYTWIKDGTDKTAAELRVKYKDNEQVARYTLDDAKTAGLVKPNSGWTKNPANMLRARVTSNGVRMVCPEAIVGFYTPEELTDVAGEIESPAQPPSEFAQPVATAPKRGRPPKSATTDSTPPSPVESPTTTAAPLDSQKTLPMADAAQVQTPAPQPPTSGTPAPQESPLDIARRQRAELAIDDAKWSTVLKKLGVAGDESTANPQQLGFLTDWLQSQLAKKQQATTTKDINEWANQGVPAKA